MLLDGVAEVCEEEGLALVLIDRRPPRPDRPDVLRNALVDGVIIHCDALDADRLRLIDERQLPTVVVDAEAIGDGLSVGIDDEGGGRAAAQHVVDLGHRRVAILTLNSRGADRPHIITKARQRGYLGPLDEAGCETFVEPAGGLEWDGFAAMVRELLQRDPRPTAILAMSDDIAAGVVRVADEIGIAIPAHLSVVGFDDTPVASGLVPPLTTVRQDHATKGRLAARMLLGQVEAKRVRLPVKLVVRGSTAPPAAPPSGSV
jgi:DNA-binding LacI/PurR family transcriptional regulator